MASMQRIFRIVYSCLALASGLVDPLPNFAQLVPPNSSASSFNEPTSAPDGHGYSATVASRIRGDLLHSRATSQTDPQNGLDLGVLRTMLGPVIESAEKVLVLVNSCDSGAFLDRKGFGPNPLGPGEKG